MMAKLALSGSCWSPRDCRSRGHNHRKADRGRSDRRPRLGDDYGLVLQTEDSARILIRKSDPRWYQFHTVLHELSHVVFGHTGCSTLPVRLDGAHRHLRAGQTVLARGVATPDFDRLVTTPTPAPLWKRKPSGCRSCCRA